MNIFRFSKVTFLIFLVGCVAPSGGSFSNIGLSGGSSDPCSGNPSIGTVCADGTIYVGLTSDGNVPIYTTNCDLGQTWSASTCTGVRIAYYWNDGLTNYLTTNTSSTSTGQANTAALVAYGTSPSPAPYEAARACNALTAYGHSDWYLPASDELYLLYVNNSLFGNFYMSAAYWSSTENSNSHSATQMFNNGTQPSFPKNFLGYVRCVRK